MLELVGGGGAAGGAQGSAFAQIAYFPAHPLGANSISWAPSMAAGSLTSASGAGSQPVRRFVTGGSDCLLKIWELNGQQNGNVEASLTHTLTGHSDWVRDVAWSSTLLRKTYIASASQDKTVRIWTSETGGKSAQHHQIDQATNDYIAEWKSVALPAFPEVVWRVSWSLSGNVLAVSTGDNRVSLWKERLSGVWELVKTIEE